ncbi:UNVERIFIED_CONTAM: hypothetical protein GTU68_062272 [Idotea baltica]|nr:hypothetical protein [Idotea baltica]
MAIKYINGIPNVPEAVGPYSQAVIHGNNIYLSGQIALHPELGEIVSANIEDETEQVMKNIIAALGFLNIDFTYVLKTTIYLTDMNDFNKVNQIYSKWMGQVRPARITVGVNSLPKNANVEIQMDAVLELDDVLIIPHGTNEAIDEIGIESYQAKDNSK